MDSQTLNKTKFLEEARIKISRFKDKWSENLIQGNVSEDQAELQEDIHQLGHKVEALQNASEEEWNNLKRDFDDCIENVESRLN